MTKIRIGAWEFDDVDYDADADVLYLSIGPPRPGVGRESPEGHILRFDEDGKFFGVTLINARQIQTDAGEINVTLPTRESVEIPERLLEPA